METDKYEALGTRLREDVGETLLSVGVGDGDTLEFEQLYTREGAAAEWADDLFSTGEQEAIFGTIAAENFFDIGAKGHHTPMGELRSTTRIYEEAIVIVGWLDTLIVVVTLEPDPDAIPVAVRALDRTLEELGDS